MSFQQAVVFMENTNLSSSVCLVWAQHITKIKAGCVPLSEEFVEELWMEGRRWG
tara:strand:- start:139 stop:300 length:162 start_codon:yes stop_codon:yes gene_type:complete